MNNVTVTGKVVNISDVVEAVVLDIDESLANAIRRSITEIPVLAIDEVEIYKNDSALYDEMLGLRLAVSTMTLAYFYSSVKDSGDLFRKVEYLNTL